MLLDSRLERSVRRIFTMWLESERLPSSLTHSFLADPHFFRPDEPFGAGQHLWDGDFFSASVRWRGRFFLRIGLGLPANSHPSLLMCPDFFYFLCFIIVFLSQSKCFLSANIFLILSPNPSPNTFPPSYFPYLSSPPQLIISLFYFTVLLPRTISPHYLFSSCLFL